MIVVVLVACVAGGVYFVTSRGDEKIDTSKPLSAKDKAKVKEWDGFAQRSIAARRYAKACELNLVLCLPNTIRDEPDGYNADDVTILLTDTNLADGGVLCFSMESKSGTTFTLAEEFEPVYTETITGSSVYSGMASTPHYGRGPCPDPLTPEAARTLTGTWGKDLIG